MSSRANKKGKCIFCGDFGLTKQHVLPDWLKNVLPRDGNSCTQMLTGYRLLQRDTVLLKPEIKNKQGHLGTMKIRKVCQPCNGGWMSCLENDVKQMLTEMILGKKIILNQEQIICITKWIIMTNIMIEYTDLPTQAIPDNNRYDLKNDIIPQEGWKIWIGYYEGDRWKFRYRHHGCLIAHRNNLEECNSTKCNIQYTTLVLGNLLIHTRYSAVREYMPDFNEQMKDELICVWPNQGESVKWPPKKKIDDNEADIISDVFFFQQMGDALH